MITEFLRDYVIVVQNQQRGGNEIVLTNMDRVIPTRTYYKTTQSIAKTIVKIIYFFI